MAELISTPGAADANSYCSVEQANDYIASNYLSTDPLRIKWNNVQETDKPVLLMKATAFLDSIVRWHFARETNTQALAFPAKDVPVMGSWATGDEVDHKVPAGTIPAAIVQGQVEVALGFLGGSVNSGSSRTLDSLKVGSVSLDFNQDSNPSKLFPTSVELALRRFGSFVKPTAERDPKALNVGTWERY